MTIFRFTHICILFGISDSLALWVGYRDPRGSMTVVEVMVPYATLSTYYCTLQWNAGAEGGGYAGLQCTGSEERKHVHFSLWDPGNHQPIEPVHNYNNEVNFERFGGEGTGNKSMWPFTWMDGSWYTMAIKVWDVGQSTHWGLWFRDVDNDRWYHVFTMKYPISGVRLSSIAGFLEDFGNTPHLSMEYRIRKGWKLTDAGE